MKGYFNAVIYKRVLPNRDSVLRKPLCRDLSISRTSAASQHTLCVKEIRVRCDSSLSDNLSWNIGDVAENLAF